MKATKAQCRILALLDTAEGRWVHLKWLDTTLLLEPDDFPAVPSLIENGWAEYRAHSLRITEAGTTALLQGARSSGPG